MPRGFPAILGGRAAGRLRRAEARAGSGFPVAPAAGGVYRAPRRHPDRQQVRDLSHETDNQRPGPGVAGAADVRSSA